MDLEKGESAETNNGVNCRQSVEDVNRAFRGSTASFSSLGSSSSSASQSQSELERDYISRIQTADSLRSGALGRYPTASSRIATQRSQHSATVGAGLRARAAKGPLPEFGAGKPYPAPLPEKEDYVVEFAGPDDPLHPQNWSTGKK